MKASKRTLREATQLLRACVVDGVLDAGRVRGVVQQYGEAKPRGYLTTLQVFLRLLKLEAARHTARIESAQPLPEDLRQNVLKNLANAYGPGMTTSFADNPELIGGLRIQVGSDVYDGSIRGRLARLERSF